MPSEHREGYATTCNATNIKNTLHCVNCFRGILCFQYIIYFWTKNSECNVSFAKHFSEIIFTFLTLLINTCVHVSYGVYYEQETKLHSASQILLSKRTRYADFHDVTITSHNYVELLSDISWSVTITRRAQGDSFRFCLTFHSRLFSSTPILPSWKALLLFSRPLPSRLHSPVRQAMGTT